MPTATGAAHDLVGALTSRLPGAAAALDPAWAAERVHAWREQRGQPTGVALSQVEVGPVAVGDVLYRDDGSLTLRYRPRAAEPPSADAAAPGATVATGAADGGRGHESGEDGVPTFLVSVPADGGPVGLHEFPDDPGLPTLPAATDPPSAVDMLRRTLPLPRLAPGVTTCRVTVVHHPRRGACVLRYDVTPDASGHVDGRPSPVFAKVYGSATEARRAAAVARALREAVLGTSSGLTLPEVLGVDAPLAVLLLNAVPGTTPPPAAGLEAAGRAAAALHRCPAPSGLPAVARGSALARLDAELGLVASVWPQVADRVRVLSLQGMRRGLATRCAPLVPCHGDLTPAQLLVTDDRVALVDLDGACLAEAASDVGRYLAYLDAALARRAVVPAPTRSAPSGQCFLQAYLRAGGAGVPDPEAFHEQVRMYRSLNLALMALSAARRLKPRRLSTALALLTGGATP